MCLNGWPHGSAPLQGLFMLVLEALKAAIKGFQRLGLVRENFCAPWYFSCVPRYLMSRRPSHLDKISDADLFFIMPLVSIPSARGFPPKPRTQKRIPDLARMRPSLHERDRGACFSRITAGTEKAIVTHTIMYRRISRARQTIKSAHRLLPANSANGRCYILNNGEEKPLPWRSFKAPWR